MNYYSNYDLENIVTPIDVAKFEELLNLTNYDPIERDFVIDGFTNGFDIGYQEPQERRSTAKNIPFTVGDKFELWDKIMKEVKEGQYAGPYEQIPFENYIQSPIGLVPKVGGKTRLIFHLSYEFGRKNGEEKLSSVNGSTPRAICLVRYNDLDHAIEGCLRVSSYAKHVSGSKVIFIGKTDLSSAFRALPLKRSCFAWFIMKVEDRRDGRIKYFVEKCLPFGASISCSHYQCFSNALKHIAKVWSGTVRKHITNYLDDFLFVALTKLLCNGMITDFLQLCQELRIPVAIEKTEWADTLMMFLGILLDGKNLVLSLPIEKQEKALRLLNEVLSKRKITVKQVQVLTGFLNFLSKAIFAGRTFTRWMYSKYTNCQLKPFHHIKVDNEFKLDAEIWKTFLTHYRDLALCRPMVDINKLVSAKQLEFYSDASACQTLGVGAVFNKHWLFARWEENFISECRPSIEYLELYGVVASVLTWGQMIKDTRVIIYCDNAAVVSMVNNLASSCRNCMYLLRLLTLKNLINNRRIFAKHLFSKENFLADTLSRLQFDRFWHLALKDMNKEPSKISPLVWPVTKIWQNE